MKYPPNVRLVRLMCSGRLDPAFVLSAFAQGADAVIVSGCWPGECHYQVQNLKALRRFQLLRRVVAGLGIEPARLQLVWASAAEGQRLANEIARITEEVRALGPLGWGGGGAARAGGGRGRRRGHGHGRARRGPRAGGGAGMSTTTAAKPRLAMYWAASCGGCDIAVLNLHEKILDVAEAVEIVFWPAVMDAKYHDVEAMPDGSIDVCLFSGGIRNSENEELAHLLRRKSKVLVAFGSCANEGCIPGLANLSTVREPSSPPRTPTGPARSTPRAPCRSRPGRRPRASCTSRRFAPVLRTLDQVVPVDYRVPGCPPESPRIAEAITALLAGLAGTGPLPPPGSVVGGGVSTVCDECARSRNVKKITRFVRIQEVAAAGPGAVPAGAGHPLQRPGDAGRLRRAVPGGRRPVHRLLRGRRRRRRLRRRG